MIIKPYEYKKSFNRYPIKNILYIYIKIIEI